MNPIASGKMTITWQREFSTEFGLLVVLAVAKDGPYYRSLVTIPMVRINMSDRKWDNFKDAKLQAVAMAMTATNNFYNALLAAMNTFQTEDEETDRVSEIQLPDSGLILPGGMQ